MLLVIQQRRSGSIPRGVRDLHQLFVDRALAAWPPPDPRTPPPNRP